MPPPQPQLQAGPEASARAARPDGFTMIELVIVLALIAAVAMVGAPRFFRAQARDQLASRDLEAALRYGVKLAIGTGCSIRVDFPGGGYRLRRADGPSCDQTTFNTEVIDPRSQKLGYSGSVPGGVTSVPAGPFVFNGLGRVTDTSGTPITQITVTAGGRSIVIWGETGFVE